MAQLSMHTRRVRLGMFWFVASLLILTLGALPASADTFNLTSCHISSGCPAAGTVFGTVTLTQSGNDVTFDVVLTSGNTFVETGSGGGELFLFNDTLTNSTITNVTGTINGTPNTSLTIVGFTNLSPVMADGTGTFTASVECKTASDCNGTSPMPGGNINDLEFTVTNATLQQLETANGNGNIFVADIFCGLTGCTGSATGPVDVSSPVPEPVSMLLFGSGLVAIGAKLRRRKSQNLVAA